jgi:hypothetical protein
MLLYTQAEPLAGGQLLGSGRMWVSPIGEVDPRAVKVRFEGRNLPTETLLKRYLPKVGCSPCAYLWRCKNDLSRQSDVPNHMQEFG